MMRTLVTCTEHPACQYEVEAGLHHPADPQPDSPAEVAIRANQPDLVQIPPEGVRRRRFRWLRRKGRRE